ncbi:8963_t:CDS:10 [Dentiscutata erythropus]|uniref:HECT-type E3 ubiquitin transferase n=1 Tax=Dentiscutata erythropus TaxID=1348616 RepID=A0A9N9A807_9GLOM|nr:8963_t:CDS:10 [Dentiscutata erythropus]
MENNTTSSKLYSTSTPHEKVESDLVEQNIPQKPSKLQSLRMALAKSRDSLIKVQPQQWDANRDKNESKIMFEKVVRRLRSQRLQNQNSSRISTDTAAILSVYFASRSRHFFCSHCPIDPDFSPPRSNFTSNINNVIDDDQRLVHSLKPFIYSFFSTSPFVSLFSYSIGCESSTENIDSTKINHLSHNDTEDIDLSTIIRTKQNIINNNVTRKVTSASRPIISQNENYVNSSQSIKDPILSHSDRKDNNNTSLLDGNEEQLLNQLSLKILTLPLLRQAIISTYHQSDSIEYNESKIMKQGYFIFKDYIEGKRDKSKSFGKQRQSGVIRGNPKFLLNTIKTVFSSRESLDQSFMETTTQYSHPSKIDFGSLRTSYKLILDLRPHELFASTLSNALEVLLARIEMDPHILERDEGSLRQLFIIMECPLLAMSGGNVNLSVTLVKRLVRILGNIADLRGKAQNRLIGLFSKYDVEGFSNIIHILHRYLDDHYHPPPALVSQEVVATVKTLAMLSNEKAEPRTIVPYTLFYNICMCEKLNIKEEYKNWRKSLEESSLRLTPNRPFSFLNYPILFDPVVKSHLSRIDALCQMALNYEDSCVHHTFYVQSQRYLTDNNQVFRALQERTIPGLYFEVRREYLVKDALDQLIVKQLDLKKPLRVKFISGEEEAQDQGGIQREFFQVLLEKLLDPDAGMFLYDEQTRYHWINGASLENERKFELVGITLGVALFNGILVDINLPRILYKKLLNYSINLDDMKEGFPDLSRGLEKMLTWEDGDVYDVFLRHFEISYDVYGEDRVFPLIDGGSHIKVTNKNRKEYVENYINHFTNKYIEKQFNALKRGFLRMSDGIVPKLCRAEELELLICGNRVLDFKELEKTVRYEGGFDRNHHTIKNFWSVVHNFSHQQKKQILAFVTASDRVPIRGYSDMSFTIQKNGPDSDRLPTAQTCFGVLLLPDYNTKAKLRDRLLVAIQNGRGFGFA